MPGVAVGGWRRRVGACVLPPLAVVVLAAAPRQPPQALDSETAALAADVRRLLSDRCFACHGPDAAKRKAKLRLDTRDGLFAPLDGELAVVAPGDPSRTELLRRIELAAGHDDVMPPADSHLTLAPDEKALLRRWVERGAPYRGHWSWEPLARPTASAQSIDEFVRQRLAREGLSPAPPATPETLVRRVAFTLTGLPPTPDALESSRKDPSTDAYARYVESLLASPAYGERMATDWLDLARYADTYGYQADVTRDMSPWRDWVIRAFNDNLPYDQFLTWQLAGDLLPSPTRDQRVATAFNRLHRQTNEGGSIEEEFRTEYVADRVNTFGTAMLGVTLECARCHDHKFDAITQRDYFSLFAFFNSIDEYGLYSHFTNATPTPAMRLWPAHEERAWQQLRAQIDELETQVRALADRERLAMRRWRRAAPDAVARPTPLAYLPLDATDEGATLHEAPAVVDDPGAVGGRAMRFSGDNALSLAHVREFSRTDEFSIALRLKPTQQQARAIVVHQSRAWTDAGSRGFEVTLDEGRPFFGLIHFWPGNAVAIRARTPLALDRWTELVVTYDGSSRASGLVLYVDGRRAEVDVVRDGLTRDIGYDPAAGDQSAKAHPITLAARFRDSGFKDGLIDDVRVYDTALTEAEVAGRIETDAMARAHYAARVSTRARTLRALLDRLRRDEQRAVARVPELMVMEELPTPRPAYLLARGAYDAPRDVVPRRTPASLPPLTDDLPRNRLGLARWLTSPTHPLTARVVVNRVWRQHFGRGLVATVEDVGSQGSPPSHPELLDWLATRLIDSGWDLKALHRLIVHSETFRQSSLVSADARARDPENVLLARGPVVRLSAEAIRDAALAASGLLVTTVGGPSVKPYQPDGLWEQSGTGQTYTQDTGEKLYRRSLYTFWRRTSPPPSMMAFDAITREVCVARREVTLTPLQSLVLLNDPQFVEAARVLAERVLAAHPDDVSGRHRAIVERLVGREPRADELDVLRHTWEEQRAIYADDPAAALALASVGERPRQATLDAADVAATTMVASLVMSLDAFVTIR